MPIKSVSEPTLARLAPAARAAAHVVARTVVRATALAAAYTAAFNATPCCAVALAAGGALAADAEGSRIFLSACAGCHGDRGQGNAGLGAPNIGGLDAWYIERQLHDFASGMRD